ncbi:hypothetical protein ACH3XW_47570 [Acanthocheilonema viteae]
MQISLFSVAIQIHGFVMLQFDVLIEWIKFISLSLIELNSFWLTNNQINKSRYFHVLLFIGWSLDLVTSPLTDGIVFI